ncbi:nucleotide disphospho-sugar-binding domain-containing protein [Streptomyces sp. NPDC016566]|uniref:nucleotide disphospho-sugar-binding domain-containing protein n=1 Tax=unclassified Streptomyces TaxID=2593676 RepID=UPI00119D13D8|nr:nucleotide disphospho-sugar-binding domain-containing protein [Streptomyces sp. BK340]TVZ80480.1 glycosyltransferase/glycosyltransferase [Streptomyces sp. BK340]
MRVLILSSPESTHFSCMAPLAWALRGAGHEVLVAGQPDIVPMARATGLSTVTVGRQFFGKDLLSPALPPDKRPIEVVGPHTPKMTLIGSRIWVLHSRYLAPRYLEVARQYRPDLVISEMLDWAALLVGGALKIPVVSHRWGVDPMSPLMRGTAEDLLAGACERLGIEGGLPRPDVVLDPAPPQLLCPGTPAATPIRHIPFNGTGEVPGWLRQRGERPRVCVSMGRQTLALGGIPLFRGIIQAFGDIPEAEAVMTVQEEFLDRLGTVPSNVRLVPPTPLNGFVDRMDAVVTHGGANTLLTVAGRGVPQLILPQLADQFEGGERLAAADAGLSLATADEQNDPAAVAAAVRTLLTEERFAKGARKLADTMAAMPSPAAVVRDLENL